MKFSVDRQAFIDGLKLVGPAVSKRSALPVLNNVLLQADDEGVQLWASNLELMLSTRVAAAVEQGGAITLPYQAMSDLLAAMEGDGVNFTLDPARDEVTITGEGTEVRLKGIDAGEFPSINTVLTENVTRLAFEEDELARSWGSVAFAAATEDARPTLTTMLLRVAESEMVMAATDGFRLVWRHDPVTVMEGETVEALIPAQAIGPIASLVKGMLVTATFNCNELVIEAEGRVAHVQLADGNYPAYEALIEDKYQTTVQVDQAGLAEALSLMVVMCKWSAGNPAAMLTWEESGEEPAWVLASAASGTGEAEAVYRPVTLTGPAPQRCAFNANYLADALAHCPGEQAALMMNSHLAPMLVRPLTGADWNCMIMPHNLI